MKLLNNFIFILCLFSFFGCTSRIDHLKKSDYCNSLYLTKFDTHCDYRYPADCALKRGRESGKNFVRKFCKHGKMDCNKFVKEKHLLEPPADLRCSLPTGGKQACYMYYDAAIHEVKSTLKACQNFLHISK